MRLLMHVLKRNKRLNIDNRRLGTIGIISKLNEEVKEVEVELLRYKEKHTKRTLKNIVAETFDVMQICILILWRCHLESKRYNEPDSVQDVNLQHKDKLMGRGWEIETGIEINVKE